MGSLSAYAVVGPCFQGLKPLFGRALRWQQVHSWQNRWMSGHRADDVPEDCSSGFVDWNDTSCCSGFGCRISDY